MKLIFTLLVPMFFLGCGAGSGSDSSGKDKAKDFAQCNPELRACVGDPVSVPAPGGSAKTTVLEIVPKGKFSAGELVMLAKAGAQRPAVEKTLNDMGLRIYTGSADRTEGPYWGNLLDNSYLLKGCLAPGRLCIGESNYIWLGYRVVHQIIVGFKIRSQSDTPVLVSDVDLNNMGSMGNSVQDLGDGLIDNGCMALPDSTYNYCVGEKFSDDQGESVIIYISANPKKPAVILKNTATGKQRRLPAGP